MSSDIRRTKLCVRPDGSYGLLIADLLASERPCDVGVAKLHPTRQVNHDTMSSDWCARRETLTFSKNPHKTGIIHFACRNVDTTSQYQGQTSVQCVARLIV